VDQTGNVVQRYRCLLPTRKSYAVTGNPEGFLLPSLIRVFGNLLYVPYSTQNYFYIYADSIDFNSIRCTAGASTCERLAAVTYTMMEVDALELRRSQKPVQ